jgi:hypothetical protein
MRKEMAIGREGTSHAWLGAKITLRAPRTSGVYAIFNAKDWIYVGETGNLRAGLLAIFDGNNACINGNDPLGFQFELATAKKRVARRKRLIRELKPICNQKTD